MKIKFEAFDKQSEMLFDMPKPAVMSIPEWYKKMPTYMDEEKIAGLSKNTVSVSNFTAKGCSPLLDAFSAGYIFELPFDIEFRRNERGDINIRWATNINLISSHAEDQAPGFPTPVGGASTLLKWRPGWRIITPSGWSTLFTHPLNRYDLPFKTISGVVDTDLYPLGVEFPFQLIDNLEKEITILKKGTPICQAIPIKREDWKSGELKVFDEEENAKSIFNLKSTIFKSYKKNFWQKKRYQ